MMARLLGEELPAPPPAVKAPTPEPGPPPRSTAAKETAAPVIASAPATAEPIQPPSQAPPPLPAAAPSAKSGASQRRAVLAAAERADSGIEVRNGTRTQNLAHLTRTLLSLQGFNVVQIGNYIDFGVAATVIYYRTEAEKVARALQSEIFPGASLEASSRLKNGVDIKVLLGHDLEVQPRMMARLLGEELAAPPPAVKAPTPEPGPHPRFSSREGNGCPGNRQRSGHSRAQSAASQAPPPLPAAAPPERQAVLAAAERADSGIEVRNGTRTQNLAHLTPLLALPDFNVVQTGNQIDSGVADPEIYWRTAAEKVARALQSEIFPGASLEASSRLQDQIDLKVLLESDLLAQSFMIARLLGEEQAASPPAVKAPMPEAGPPPRSTAAQETAAPVIASAPATAEPSQPQSQAPPPLPAAAPPERRAILAAAERADNGIEVRNGTRAQNLAHLTPLSALPDFNVLQIGNHVDPGVDCRTAAEKVARALQSEIFPGASLEASSRPPHGIDIQGLLENDLVAQSRMLARLVREELAAPPLAVKAPTPEPGPPPRSTAAQETAAPVIASAPATAEPSQPPSQAPPPLPPAAAPERRAILAAAERADSGIEVRNGTRAQNLAHLTPLSALPDFNVLQIGNQIDPGVDCRTAAEKVARALQSEIFPGASLEASSRPQNGADLKGLLGSELLAQPLMLARLLGEEKAAAPAAASAEDIQRHIDSRGVLHIGNAPPSQPPPSQPDSPSAVREAMIAEPRPSRSRQVRLTGQTEETYTPEANLEAIQKACQGLAPGETPAHEFDGIIAAAAQAEAEKEAVEVAVDYNHPPVRQVSHDQEVIPAPAPQPAAPKIAEAAAIGDIRRYRDPRGVPISAMRPRASRRRASPTAPARFAKQ